MIMKFAPFTPGTDANSLSLSHNFSDWEFPNLIENLFIWLFNKVFVTGITLLSDTLQLTFPQQLASKVETLLTLFWLELWSQAQP